MTITQPEEPKWTAWFWLGMIILTFAGVTAVAAFLLYALWRGM